MAAVGEKRTIRCPTCGKTVAYDGTYFPFCCQRCKLVDLGRWLDGAYRVPGEEAASSIDGDGSRAAPDGGALREEDE